MNDPQKHGVGLEDQYGKSVKHQNESSEPHKYVIEATIRLPDFRPSECHKHKPESKWHQTIDGKRLALEILAFVLAAIYGFIYYGQLGANRRQAVAAEKQLAEMQRQIQLDQRPWLGGPVRADTNVGALFIGISFTNTGKTPALRVQEMDSFTDPSAPMINVSNVPTDANRISAMIFPGQGFEVSTAHDLQFARKVAEMQGAWTITRRYTVIVWYDDRSGKHYWTRFSYIINPGFQISVPQNGNDCDTEDDRQN
jgi:hypothetical protein